MPRSGAALARLIISALLLFSLGPNASGVESDEQYFNKTMERIKKKDPDIPTEVLERDQKVVLAAIGGPEVKGALKENQMIGENDVHQAVAGAWIALRVGPRALPKDRAITARLIRRALVDMRQVNIESKPDGASLLFDSVAFDDTDTTIWSSPGEHRLQLSKDGYEPVDEKVTVKKSAETTIKKTLKKK